jgi:hypothetical protein
MSIVFVPPALKEERRVSSVVVATRRVCRGTDVLPGAVPSQPPPSIKFTSVAQTRRCRSTKYFVSFFTSLGTAASRVWKEPSSHRELQADAVTRVGPLAFRNTRIGLDTTLLLAYCTEVTCAYIYQFGRAKSREL